MPRVIKRDDGKWIIARNFQVMESNAVTGSRGRSAGMSRQVYESWDGNSWIDQRFMAKTFESQQEADNYLVENLNRMN